MFTFRFHWTKLNCNLPDYLQVIDTPMDLMTIKEDLVGGNYDSPAAFVKDVRLIFANSRNYNTNKRSPVSSDHFCDAMNTCII